MDLTREQILNMTAQELAEATAVHVMGWNKRQTDNEFNAPIYGWYKDGDLIVLEDEWNPAEDIRNAWEIVKKMRDEFAFELSVPGKRFRERWAARFGMMNEHEFAETAPLAICRAALLAVKGL